MLVWLQERFFSDLGNDVICVDKLPEKVDMLNKSIMPNYDLDWKKWWFVTRMTAVDLYQIWQKRLKNPKLSLSGVGTPPKLMVSLTWLK